MGSCQNLKDIASRETEPKTLGVSSILKNVAAKSNSG